METDVKEFDCTDCGQHIFSYSPAYPAETRCMTCIWLPGWFKDPQLRELLHFDEEGQ